ncbi:G-protein coupled receptor 83-like [Oppia nitens]|uniref:G-protein coupled receptor 83-like n=1 Tax=Oppia nitens TaxID=1686743 RepID=UPI0023D9D421|nr:G-protein coupled receptor 83-like [Oppia nitens]
MYEKRRPLSKTNALITNLAVADLMMTILNIPFNILRFVLDNWPFGETMCKLVPFIQSTSVHCSSISMMFIAIERYRNVVGTVQDFRQFNQRKCWPHVRTLVLIWSLSVLLSIPHGLYNQLVSDRFLALTRCKVTYPSQQFRQWLTIFTLLSQYLTPIFITIICYMRIGLFLWRRRIVGTVSEGQRLSINRRKKRRIKMLFMVVLVFAICWLPLNVYHILSDFKFINYRSVLFFTVHWFAMSSVW